MFFVVSQLRAKLLLSDSISRPFKFSVLHILQRIAVLVVIIAFFVALDLGNASCNAGM